jgi:hypothetical protein
MTSVLRRIFPKPPQRPLVPAGLYHSMTADSPRSPYRLHLRVDPSGQGLLIINAATVLHLNETATAIAWHMVQGNSDDEVSAWTAERFRVDRQRARNDVRLVRDQIESLAQGEDQDPEVVMGMDRLEPYSTRPAAPYRLDLALTYRSDDGVTADPTARRRVTRELETGEWTDILSRAWEAGVPHVIFTGGEPTVRDDLVDLVAHAESLGQVSGVVTGAHRLADPSRLDALSQAGLDHLMLVVDFARAATDDGIRRAVAADVFCAAHLTLGDDPRRFDDDLRRLKDLGITHVSVSSPPGTRAQAALEHAEGAIAGVGLDLVWDVPVPYTSTNPVRLQLDEPAARRAWLYVEPDGDVLPRQESDAVLGNLLKDSIQDLWSRDAELSVTSG